MKTAILLIATGGEQYMRYVSPLINSLDEFFPPHDVMLFTDSEDSFDAIKVPHAHLGWPHATLMRYHAILEQETSLSRYDQLFYMDIDMLACSKIEGEEVFSDGITAVLHPGYVTTFERNPESTACVKGNPPNYYQGCLQGGDSKAFLGMCKTLAKNVDIDSSNGIIAIWHDESHLNCYLASNPPARILSPAYCFPALKYLVSPERWMTGDLKSFVPKIRHLEKLNQGEWKGGN
jgi:hypothetical protein